MWSLILWGIAPIFNAISDLVENENYYQSVFSKFKNPKFWYKRESWSQTPDIFGYSVDAWHISKSLWIIFMATSATIAYFEGPIHIFNSNFLNALIDLGLRGILWNVVFSVFYHKLFRLKHAKN